MESEKCNHEHGPRQRRLETQIWPVDPAKTGVVPWKDGELFRGASVSGSTLTFTMNDMQNRGLYPDDVLAVFRDLYAFYLKKHGECDFNKTILHALRTALETADKRAVARHGFSGSERERTYVPNYTVYSPRDEIIEYVKDAIYFVEADSYARTMIWVDYSKDDNRYNSKYWKQNNQGFYCTVGELMGRPIVVELFQYHVNGKKIIMYSATSQLVDYAIIEEFFEKHFEVYKNGQRKMTNSLNVFHAISAAFSNE